jgi:HAE1 family hydrophobic/amphiphilic exporter-1
MLADAGLNVTDIAFQLRGAISGLVASQYKDKGEEYDIRVMADDESFDTPEELTKLPISSGDRNFTLGQLTEIEFQEGFSNIMHQDKYKSIKFGASPAPGYAMGDVSSVIVERLADIDFQSGYKVSWGGQVKLLNEAVADILFALALAIILTYMLLAAILENLTQPILVMGTFPLALIGVVWGLIISGLTLNIISMMAIVMLLGIVVNNAILILDYVNELHKKGINITDALIEACPAKLRPILMSSIAIILGMLPMALGMGDAGREIRQPMGVVSIGGLIVSTALTLIVIPATYNLFSKKHKKEISG